MIHTWSDWDGDERDDDDEPISWGWTKEDGCSYDRIREEEDEERAGPRELLAAVIADRGVLTIRLACWLAFIGALDVLLRGVLR